MRKLKYIMFTLLLFCNVKMFSQVVLPESISLQKGKPVMIMLTASWCGPCKIMKDKVLSDEAVQKELVRFENVLIDVDSQEGKKFKSSFDKSIGFEGGIPFFILLDDEGNFVASKTGLMHVAPFVSFLKKVKEPVPVKVSEPVIDQASEKGIVPEKETQAIENVDEIKIDAAVSYESPVPVFKTITRSSTYYPDVTIQKKRLGLYKACVYYGWAAEIEPHISFGWYTGNAGYSNTRTGYGLYLGGRKEGKWLDCAAGLSIDSWGAKSENGTGTSTEYFLRLPIEIERSIVRYWFGASGICADIHLRGGVWGGVAFAGKTPASTRKLDAGVQAALVCQMGTFDLSVGYARGFVNRFTAPGVKAYNNAVTIGISMNIGD